MAAPRPAGGTPPPGGREREHPPGRGGIGAGWRAAVRRRPGGALLLKAASLLLGVAFIALGFALIVLPGPLTIPPILLGLYVLSLEFAWAQRLLERAQDSAREAWEAASRTPVRSSLITGGGLVLAAVAVWAVLHYDLVARARSAVGL